MDPSYGEDDFEERGLPDGVTEEQVDSLVRDVLNVVEKLGLYATDRHHLLVQEGRIHLFIQFEIGSLAFSKRVQNPEQDKVDNTFHQIETEAVRDRVEEIKDKFRGKQPPQDPTA